MPSQSPFPLFLPHQSSTRFLLLHLVLIIQTISFTTATNEIVDAYTPAPGIPPPIISFIDPVHPTPGMSDNYTLSLVRNITLQSERNHIQEHLEIPLNTSQMTEKELHFHYFNMYDTDRNRMLDGIEISKQILDQLGHLGGHNETEAVKIFTDDELIEIIDSILSIDDLNKDGFVDYYEFHLSLASAKNG